MTPKSQRLHLFRSEKKQPKRKFSGLTTDADVLGVAGSFVRTSRAKTFVENRHFGAHVHDPKAWTKFRKNFGQKN